MQSNTSKMTLEARMVINDAIREWLNNTIAVDATCILSEIFTGLRKSKRVVMLRGRLQKFLRAELRVRFVGFNRHIGNMEVKRIDDIGDLAGWHSPSLVLLATMTGVDHSGLVKKRKAVAME